MGEKEFFDVVKQLYQNHLQQNGFLCFTFLEAKSSIYFLEKRFSVNPNIELSLKKNWIKSRRSPHFIMVNDGVLSHDMNSYPRDCDHLLTFYNKDYLLNKFEKSRPVYKGPYKDYLQSFIIIEKD